MLDKLMLYTHSIYVILNTFPWQQWLRECASMLRYKYIAYLVKQLYRIPFGWQKYLKTGGRRLFSKVSRLA